MHPNFLVPRAPAFAFLVYVRFFVIPDGVVCSVEGVRTDRNHLSFAALFAAGCQTRQVVELMSFQLDVVTVDTEQGSSVLECWESFPSERTVTSAHAVFKLWG